MKEKYGRILYIALYIIGLGGALISFFIETPQKLTYIFILIFLLGRWISFYINKKEW